jgi:hypothetical protein
MMDINTLRQFRHDLYDCLPRAKDVLFNTMDALMTETQAKSFPELSQSLWFERKWSSLYEAFEDGRIDEKHLREIFVRYLPKPAPGKWLWLGIDASSIARPDAVTSADRTAQHVHNLPECKKPVTFGWQFSTLVALAEPVSSWTYILDQQRVASGTTAIEVAEEQLRRLVSHLPKQAIVVLDRGYDANWLWCRCSALDLGVLGRLKSNRCLYRPAPAPTGKKGCPRKDGAKLQPKDPTTHGEPDGMWKGTDAKGRPVEVTSWKRMHVKQARYLDVTVIRVVRPHATNKERDPRVSWFVWIGDQEADVIHIALGYVLRFGQEHGYRFDKQALLWEKPSLGKHAAPADPATGAARDAQIVGTFGHPCPTTTPSRKIQRPQFWGQDWQGKAVFGRSQDAKTASAGPNLMIFLTFSSVLALFTELLTTFW